MFTLFNVQKYLIRINTGAKYQPSIKLNRLQRRQVKVIVLLQIIGPLLQQPCHVKVWMQRLVNWVVEKLISFAWIHVENLWNVNLNPVVECVCLTQDGDFYGGWGDFVGDDGQQYSQGQKDGQDEPNLNRQRIIDTKFDTVTNQTYK